MLVKRRKASVKGLGRKTNKQRYQELFIEVVSEGDWQAIIRTAVLQAKKGERHARQWLSSYLVGLPVQRIAPTDPTGERMYQQLTDTEIQEIAASLMQTK